ncbi:MAG: hypothetical protein WBB34_22550 [Xanthobacteraceae bacterium]
MAEKVKFWKFSYFRAALPVAAGAWTRWPANVRHPEPVAPLGVAFGGRRPLDKCPYFRSMGAVYGPFGLDCYAFAAN